MKNPRVFFLAFVGLILAIMGFFINWIFLGLAVIIMIINQKEIFRKIKNA